MKKYLLLISLLTYSFTAFGQEKKKCLYVSSYHKGYAWSDGLERGIKKVLHNQCEFKQLDMDTKRNKDEAFKVAAAEKAKQMIESYKPDVLLVSDDNAAKYLVQPFYKDVDLPIVFCGVNWSAKEYGFPYSNVTGIVEIAPVADMLQKAVDVSKGGKKAVYIGANTPTEIKNINRFLEAAEKMGLAMDKKQVSTAQEWIDTYKQAQVDYDFVILGSKAGINDWDPTLITNTVKNETKKFSATNHSWMMPFATYGMSKLPSENGEKAANYALKILNGTSPTDLPIITNEQWRIWINEPVLKTAGISINSLKLPKENVFRVGGGEFMASSTEQKANTVNLFVIGGILLGGLFFLITLMRRKGSKGES